MHVHASSMVNLWELVLSYVGFWEFIRLSGLVPGAYSLSHLAGPIIYF